MGTNLLHKYLSITFQNKGIYHVFMIIKIKMIILSGILLRFIVIIVTSLCGQGQNCDFDTCKDVEKYENILKKKSDNYFKVFLMLV